MEDTLSLNSTASSQQQTGALPTNQSSPSNSSTGGNSLVLVRIGVPELNVEKCLQYQKDEVIWEVKQQALSALPKVRETLNKYKPVEKCAERRCCHQMLCHM